MRLAALAGLNVAQVSMTKAANKDVLLIKRFDRKYTHWGWTRKLMISALTLFGLDDMMARYASYEIFAEIIRHRFTHPKKTLREHWDSVCDEAQLSEVDKNLLWGRQFFNPFSIVE